MLMLAWALCGSCQLSSCQLNVKTLLRCMLHDQSCLSMILREHGLWLPPVIGAIHALPPCVHSFVHLFITHVKTQQECTFCIHSVVQRYAETKVDQIFPPMPPSRFLILWLFCLQMVQRRLWSKSRLPQRLPFTWLLNNRRTCSFHSS